jgi:hypothetical protein
MYTLQGKSGDQVIDNGYNKFMKVGGPLCVLITGSSGRYKSYGLFEIVSGPHPMQWPGEDGVMRTIYRYELCRYKL